jgi:hypothetical protein
MCCRAPCSCPQQDRGTTASCLVCAGRDRRAFRAALTRRGRGSHRGCALGGRMHGDGHPAAGTRGEPGGDPHRGHPRLPGVTAEAQVAIMPLRVRALRPVERTEHGLESSHHDRPSAPRASPIASLGVASHPPVSCRWVQPRRHVGSAPVAWSAMGMTPRAASTRSPWPQCARRASTGGPADAGRRPLTALRKGHGTMRPPAVLGRWRRCGGRPRAPGAPSAADAALPCAHQPPSAPTRRTGAPHGPPGPGRCACLASRRL